MEYKIESSRLNILFHLKYAIQTCLFTTYNNFSQSISAIIMTRTIESWYQGFKVDDVI